MSFQSKDVSFFFNLKYHWMASNLAPRILAADCYYEERPQATIYFYQAPSRYFSLQMLQMKVNTTGRWRNHLCAEALGSG